MEELGVLSSKNKGITALAHNNGVVGVEGSNPFAPTSKNKHLGLNLSAFFVSKSLSDEVLGKN